MRSSLTSASGNAKRATTDRSHCYRQMMRWLYHLLLAQNAHVFPYAPPSLAEEGFIHASYQPSVAESARMYFAPNAHLCVYRIDPQLVASALNVALTPRGPMPHIRRALYASDVVEILTLAAFADAPDVVNPTR